MIDEFQDINKAQWAVIKMLSTKHKNVFMVGDGNQSIYGFRGSNPEFLYNIKDEFPNVKIMHMAKNYRSGDNIINVANSVAKNTKYFMTEIEGTGKSDTVEYVLFESEEDQAHGITNKIKLLLEDGVDPDEIGVIFRTNECAGLLELKLAKKDIKFKSPKGDGFFGSKIVKDCLAYLTASLMDRCESDLSRIINVPNRYLGAAFKAAWEANIESNACLPKEALLLGYGHDYWKRNASELYFHLEKIKTLSSDAKKAIKYIREGVGYEEWLLKENSDIDLAKTDMLEELEYVAAHSETVPKLLESVVEIKNHEVLESAVTLMTIHGSKGLEFEHVFFSSLIEGIIPHKWADSEEAIHEERRMFFVGITRAEKGLYLSSFGDSKGKGEKNKDGDNGYRAKPSKFLNECGILNGDS